MTPRRRLRGPALGGYLRRRSVRFRLTALYCALFFPTGVVLVVITYVLLVYVVLRTSAGVQVHVRSGHGGSITRSVLPRAGTTPPLGGSSLTIGHGLTPDLRELLIGSCVLFVAMLGASALLGWLVAGRVLRPLRVMTTTTRRISEHNLHERLALAGPDDELKDLGDTIDGLLARLEAAFDSQRRFVANASHELRTPLMLSQTLLQVALADPAITLDSLRAACQEAIDAGKDQAEIIDALLTLARSQRGLDHRERVDLTAVVHGALETHRPAATARGVQVEATLDEATVSGDAHLIDRLVSNLLDNAIRYNSTGGSVQIELATSSTETTLTVINTGPLVPADQVGRLLEPFQRAAPDRTAGPNGLGLGLSLVADIARAHGADLDVQPRPEGGLAVTVTFPHARPPLPSPVS